jgi:hypothetical protein
MHMCTYRILSLHSSSNVSQRKDFFFAKLLGAPVWSCGRVCSKNCHETLDEEWRAMI